MTLRIKPWWAWAGIAVILSATPVHAEAEFRANRLFSDHMVLQRGRPVRVFGVGPDGAAVEVSLGSAHMSTRIVKGEWTATLPALAAGGPHALTIAGPRRIELRDVLVGDVWICAGQSKNKTVVVRCAAVPEPVAVRYAWENFTLANLYHRAGLPAEPFRSDDFPLEGHLRAR